MSIDDWNDDAAVKRKGVDDFDWDIREHNLLLIVKELENLLGRDDDSSEISWFIDVFFTVVF